MLKRCVIQRVVVQSTSVIAYLLCNVHFLRPDDVNQYVTKYWFRCILWKKQHFSKIKKNKKRVRPMETPICNILLHTNQFWIIVAEEILSNDWGVQHFFKPLYYNPYPLSSPSIFTFLCHPTHPYLLLPHLIFCISTPEQQGWDQQASNKQVTRPCMGHNRSHLQHNNDQRSSLEKYETQRYNQEGERPPLETCTWNIQTHELPEHPQIWGKDGVPNLQGNKNLQTHYGGV